MPMIIEMFPQEALALQREIPNHPILMNALQRLPPDADLETRFGIVLAYAGIEIDGYFYEEDLAFLFNLALTQLKKMSVMQVH